jgi:hypothetical protein
MEVWFHTFLTSTLEVVSDQLYPGEKEPPIPIKEKAGRAPEPV